MTEYQPAEDLTLTERVIVRPRRERVVVSPAREPTMVSTAHQAVAQVSQQTSVRRERTPDPVGLSELRDMPVVSLADGARVGTIQELFVDTTRQRVVAFILASEAGESLVSFEAVRSIGPDAVTVDNALATHELRSLTDLLSLKAVSSDGTLLGELKELEVDRHTGRLIQLLVHRGGVMGLGGTQQNVPVGAVCRIGPQLATVELPDAGGE